MGIWHCNVQTLKILQDDVISTTICRDCHDQLSGFNQFCKDVSSKQSNLQDQYLGVRLKTECQDDTDDSYSNDAIFEPSIDLVKTEMDLDDDEIITGDVLNETEIAEDDNADNDYMDDDSISDDDMPLINLKCKKTKSKAKNKTNKTDPNKTKQFTREKKQKSYLSAQQIISACVELKCDICQNPVNTWKELREHYLIAHTRRPYIKCCNSVFEKQRQLADHLIRHKNPDKFRCKQCDVVLSDLKELANHIQTKHPNNTESSATEYHECPHCSRQFRSFKAYTNHLHKHNATEEGGKKSLGCLICSNKNFENEQALRQHIDTEHKDIYYHICEICGKTFKAKESFKKHYETHKGIVEPPVQCTICHKFYKNYDSLRLHRMRHEERPRSCEICGRNFTTQRTWKKHVQYWHEMEKNLPCTLCDKVFREKRNLDEHMATHTGALLYACPHCGKESRSRANMYAHVKRQHPEEWWRKKMERFNLDPDTLKPKTLPQDGQ
ncbi:zinc finger protein 888 isoform X2 [Musca domestica]|uniref:Zinc finger protein 888 isoform X2 n=1 Tax=Musca domestica TaxID=7370 RepID=A0A1I8MR93_MUSDO|nr:zinc finger protein 888 isoform X2 [Musca domestica]